MRSSPLLTAAFLPLFAVISNAAETPEGTHLFREIGKWKVHYTVDADGKYVSSDLTETDAKSDSFILSLTDQGTTVSFKGAGLAASEEAIPLTYSFSAEAKPTAEETAAAVTTTADTMAEGDTVWAVFSAADDASAALMTGFSTSGFCHIEAGEKKWTLNLDTSRNAVEALLECHSSHGGLADAAAADEGGPAEEFIDMAKEGPAIKWDVTVEPGDTKVYVFEGKKGQTLKLHFLEDSGTGVIDLDKYSAEEGPEAGIEFQLEESKRYRISAGNTGEKALTYTIFLSLE
ncbi:MAG: hypothetical protein MUF31_12025 [Akkermansiaceae bacterium]|jgi:hypothetical protein|nr:hypothetical protein [Akkermansiaceae bacterium]